MAPNAAAPAPPAGSHAAPAEFPAFIAEQQPQGYQAGFRRLRDADLPPLPVLVAIEYSSLNYKDGLAVTGRGKIIRRSPMVLGIDLAGTVLESSDARFHRGDRVLGIGQGLSETDWGGYSRRQRLRPELLMPLPEAFTPRQAMGIGTAGFTAMLALMALEEAGLRPERGEPAREIAVTGAAGGVGSLAIALLAARGYRVAAFTGRPQLEAYLHRLGAARIVPRAELAGTPPPLASERWAGAVDNVGGATLANLLAATVAGGAVAACGLAGGADLPLSVYPFILRGVRLQGISSTHCGPEKRQAAWQRLAGEMPAKTLDAVSRVEPLSRIVPLSQAILDGQIQGRVILDVNA